MTDITILTIDIKQLTIWMHMAAFTTCS